MKDVTVIKIGGSTFGSGDTTIEDIVALQKKKKPLVVVHGGGNTVTDWLKRQGIATKFVRGERVTDLPSLAVVTAVLAGLVNKDITADINIRGGRAIGISGVDGSLIESKMKDKEMGFVGSVEKVNKDILETLLKDGFVPVVSPISLYSLDRTDDAPGLINVNGDPIAGEIAAALGAKRLIYLTDVDGIKDKFGKVIARISKAEAEAMIASGVVAGGMIPKVNACLKVLNVVSTTRIIDGTKPHALLKEVEGSDGGTTIVEG
ncbi:MAG: acetylglutamate kinase [Chloroflexi bacterium RBG_16_50_11]|nr:MAG: acetylglutamate kinase [Chloroflexi bacterium RBG_16_50_11]